jgi:hypothetical protein
MLRRTIERGLLIDTGTHKQSTALMELPSHPVFH